MKYLLIIHLAIGYTINYHQQLDVSNTLLLHCKGDYITK
jgi:hypothetical protein